MKVDENTVALVAYQIYLDAPDGELIESADEADPRSMIFGYDKVIPGFENNMRGVEEGENFDFRLKPDEAFGEFRTDMLVKVPKTAFMVNGELREDLLYINNELNMMDNNGRPMKGKIVDINGESVKMDFNHPLAGKELFISGKVMHVRPITEEDLQPVSGGCCGGSCGCGSKSGDESHDHTHEEGENCQVCGNPPEKQGQGIGNCQCG
jgi:FKBP-type peptidyl-prolyl cis-trans isomerase SlyD